MLLVLDKFSRAAAFFFFKKVQNLYLTPIAALTRLLSFMKKRVSIPKELHQKIKQGKVTPVSVIVQFSNVTRTTKLYVSSFREIDEEIDKLTHDLSHLSHLEYSVNIGY